MSTKTSTIKRIALVAVAALGFGMLSGVAANAAIALSTAQGNQTVVSGTSVTADITVTGSNADTSSITITPSATTVSATYSASTAGKGAPQGVNVLAAGTSATSAVPGSVALTKVGGSSAVFSLSVTVSGTAGTVTVAGTGLSYVLTLGTTGVSTSDTPFVVPSVGNTNVTAVTPATLNSAAPAISVKKTVVSVADYVVVQAAANTVAFTGVGNYRYVEASGSTFAATTIANAVANGSYASGSTLGTATQIAMPQDGAITGGQVWVHTPTTGTVTVSFKERTIDSVTGFVSVKTLQTVTIAAAAPGALNAAKSEAVICATATTGTYPVASGCDFTVATGDDDVLAKAALATAGGVTSGIGTAKAVIQVSLKDVLGSGLIGTLPAIGASIDGPGTLSIGTSANADASTGRYLTLAAAPANVYYINVFSDGNNGTATVSIWVGGAVWKTKTVSFYGAPTKLVASTGLKVLKAGTAYAVPSTACVLAGTCGTTVALSPVVQVLATDNKGIAVPGLAYTATPDATVLLSGSSANNYGDAIADSIGATWFGVTTSPSAASGATGTVSYKTLLADGTTYLTSNTVSFAIGGAPVAVTMGLAAGASTEVGAKSSLVFTDKDAAGNAPYDADVALALTSNVALVVGTAAATAGNALPATIAMIGGTGTVKFYNPLVPGNVTISGLAAGLIAVSTTFTVQNSAVNAAADAALEAIDAATAATDAANLAAEAADAATMAAQDAKDAADAATAAVEALAQQVATMIDALKAQLKTLATIVAKIAKKVKA